MSDFDRPRWPTLDEARSMTTAEIEAVRSEVKAALTSISVQLEQAKNDGLAEDDEWRVRARTANKYAQKAAAICKSVLAERAAMQRPPMSATGAAGFRDAGRSLKAVTRLLGLNQQLFEAVGVFLVDDSDEAFAAMEAAWNAVLDTVEDAP